MTYPEMNPRPPREIDIHSLDADLENGDDVHEFPKHERVRRSLIRALLVLESREVPVLRVMQVGVANL